jgi:predicted RNase H-like HicB family nuclease
MRFLVMLTPNVEEGGFTATVPGLPGLVTEGDSIDDALSAAREAIELYFEGETKESLSANGVREDYILAEVDVPISA